MAVLHVKSSNGTQTNVDLSKLVMTDTAQSITGTKVFTNIELSDGASIRHYDYSHEAEPFALPQMIIGYMGEYPGTGLSAWESAGAKIALHNHSDNSSGGFIIRASDGTNRTNLEGFASGQLIWNGKHVLTTNGFTHLGNSGGYCTFKINNGNSETTPFIVQWGRIARNGQTGGEAYRDLVQPLHINFNTNSYALLMKSGWTGSEKIVMAYRRINEFTYDIENAASNPHDVTWIAVGW